MTRLIITGSLCSLSLLCQLGVASQDDTGFDFLREKASLETCCPDDAVRNAEALAKFAEVSSNILSSGKLSDEDASKLLRVLEIDPGARLPLAMLMAHWLEKNQAQKLLDGLLPIAEKNPHVDSLALALALAYAQLDRDDDAIAMIERTLDAIGGLDDYGYGVNYVELVIHLAELYSEKEDFLKGEELFDEALGNESLKDNFKLRRAAFMFFSKKAEDRPFSLFSGRLERRFHRKMLDSFAVVERIWLDDLVGDGDSSGEAKNTRSIELAPMVEICKKFGLVDRIENLILEKLLDTPRSAESRVMLAALFQDIGRFASARRMWKRLSDESKSNHRFFTEYGRSAMASRKFDEAIRAFEWAEFISAPARKDASSYMTALAYMNAGMLDKAISKFDKLGKMPEAHYFKALSLRRLGKDLEAAKSLDEAEKAAKENGDEEFLSQDFYMYLAFTNDRAKRFDRALEVLKQLYKDHSDEHEVCNFLGYFLADHDMELELAAEALDKAITAEPDNGAYLDSMAWLHYRRKNFEKAYKYIVKAIGNLENDPDAVVYDHAGDICKALGRTEDAVKYWRIASEIFSEDTDPLAIIEKIRKAGG